MKKVMFNSEFESIDDIANKIYSCYDFSGNILIISSDDKKAKYGQALNKILIKENINSKIIDLKNLKDEINNYDILIDCISSDILTNEEITNIKLLNDSKKTIISLDINSGLNKENGLYTDICVKSDLTIAFDYYPGHFLGHAKDCIGRIINLNISKNNDNIFLVEEADIKDIFIKRKNYSNKKTNGYVGIIGGTLEYSGAVKLASLGLASMRSGSGLSRLIIPKSIASVVATNILEVTLNLIDDIDGHMLFRESQIKQALENIDALSIGSGWGISEDNKKILEYILNNYSLPIIIDADGLNCLSTIDSNILQQTKCQVVLTPHLKEFSRLCNMSIKEIEKHAINIAKNFANANNVILLLKGPTTIITDGKNAYLVNKGCAGMAKAGSGDLLTGIILGILGYHDISILSIASGAYINGLAGEIANSYINEFSMIPSDTLNNISQAINLIIKNND